MPEFIAALLFASPLGAAAVIGLGMLNGRLHDEASEQAAASLSVLAALISLSAAVGLLCYSLLNPGQLPVTLPLFEWFGSGGLDIVIALSMDPLTLGLGCLFAVLLYITLRFSVNYLHRERGFFRFFMVLDLFAGAMLLIVYSGNPITAFLGWEMAGLSSFLLIAYAWDRPVATVNASRVFITGRVGDAGFLLALVLGFHWAGGGDWPGVNAALVTLDTMQRFVVLAGFVLAALVKSALFPFCSWITRALEGPKPSTAILYGSLMVHAGIILLLRLSPAIEASPAMQIILVLLGLLTIIYGWLGGLVQVDLKTSLIFSTLTQTGLMLVCIGFGWTTLVTLHLAAHASWRAFQILSGPAYLTLVNRSARPVPLWLQHRPLLFNAALQRLWLDNIIDRIALRPAALFAQELTQFDERFVNRMAGLPVQADAIPSLTDYEGRKRGHLNPEAALTARRGLMDALMDKIAGVPRWFEESLVLQGRGDGRISLLRKVGARLVRIDELLSQPRYLWLCILLSLPAVF